MVDNYNSLHQKFDFLHTLMPVYLNSLPDHPSKIKHATPALFLQCNWSECKWLLRKIAGKRSYRLLPTLRLRLGKQFK